VTNAHTREFQFARKIEVTVLSWRCRECSHTKITQLLPRPELTSAAVSVSLKCYVELLAEGKGFDQRFPMIGQTAWLVGGNWSFDDVGAHYRPAR